MSEFRIEKDSMGEIKVPKEAIYAAQTQRAVENFPISGLKIPRALIRALGLIKKAAAIVNKDLGLLDEKKSKAIQQAATEVSAGKHDAHFPIDLFQTGSGTSSNMNANEVIATLASRISNEKVHPNDHVNKGQSSNDVIPSTMHISAIHLIIEKLLPTLKKLIEQLTKKIEEFKDIVKVGRTHLQDAVPIPLFLAMIGLIAVELHWYLLLYYEKLFLLLLRD